MQQNRVDSSITKMKLQNEMVNELSQSNKEKIKPKIGLKKYNNNPEFVN